MRHRSIAYSVTGTMCHGVDASWLPEDRKAPLRAELAAALDALGARLDPADRALDLAVERAQA